MKILYILVFVFSFFLEARDFKVASYNVENLFDLKYDGTEYKEYKPNTKTWNKKSFAKKVENISKVINDLDADIIALQEIESQEALNALVQKNPQYEYHSFLKKETSSVGVAVLSRYPIEKLQKILVDPNDLYSRPILKVIISIENKNLTLYINHWRSKRASESKRIIYALALKKEIDTLKKEDDYIILGDLNSNYNEFQTFKYDKKLNDSFGITGINHILNTIEEGNFITLDKIVQDSGKKIHYNLWLEYQQQRYSSIFKKEFNTPDNIILPQALFDTQGISYVQNSFGVFNPYYLVKNNSINRWNISKFYGYSDHLPIFATFSTKPQHYKIKKDTTAQNSIQNLYTLQTVQGYHLKDIKVIYRFKKYAVIQRDNDRAIMVFNPPSQLQLGFSYDIVVQKITLYNGLKEITKLDIVKQNGKIKNISDYHLDANSIDLFDQKYQNNIITNLEGVYKNRELHYKQNGVMKKIGVYFHKDIKRPEENTKITIHTGHLSIYRSQVQIVLYDQKDFIKHTQGI